MLAVGAADEGEGDGAVAEGGFVDGEALFLPVVGFGDAVTDGFFEEVGGVLVVDCLAFVAALVEHAFGIDVVGHLMFVGGSERRRYGEMLVDLGFRGWKGRVFNKRLF